MKIFFKIKDIDREPVDEWEYTWVTASIDGKREIGSDNEFVAEITSSHELLFSWLVIAFGFFNQRTCELESDLFCKVPLNRFMGRRFGGQRYAILGREYADMSFANSLGNFESVGEILLEFRVQDGPLVQDAAGAPALQWGILSETPLGKLLDILSAGYKIKDFILADISYFHRGYTHLVRNVESMLDAQRAAISTKTMTEEDEEALSRCIYAAYLEVDLSEERTQASASHVYRVRPRAFYEHYKQMFHFAIAPYGNEIAVADVEGLLPCNTHGSVSVHDKIVSLLGIPEEDLLDVHITSVKGKCSFIVFLHRHYLVVSFRGTISPKDIYEDLKYEYVKIGDGYTHSGIKELAEGFVHDWRDNISALMRRHGRSHLLLTGHSMGGSVATIVGYTLLKTGFIENSRLKVVGVSSVPVFSEHIVAYWPYRHFYTVAIDFDIVPFLSLGSFLDFKYICCWFGYRLSSGRPIYSLHKEVQRLQSFLLRENIHMKLYHPGTIIHMRSFERKSPDSFDNLRNQSGNKRSGIWNLPIVGVKKYNYTFSKQICFTKNMVHPHIPGTIQDVFKNAIKASAEVENIRMSQSGAGNSSKKRLVFA